MTFTVLTDADVREVLDSLTKEDVQAMHMTLADALHSYSTATDTKDSGCCASNQPSRLSIKLKNGATTLFMPATSDDNIGIKVVTLGESRKNGSSSILDLPLRQSNSSDSRPSSPLPRSPGPRSPAMSETPRSGSPSIYQRSASPSTAQSSIHRASTASTQTSMSSKTDMSMPPGMVPLGTSVPHGSSDESGTSPSGTLTLLSPTGAPRAIINAGTLTAFRTALASTTLLKLRHKPHTITVFGAGRQAYWHIHLSLLLRGREIHHLHVINRSFERAQKLYISLARHTNPAIQDVFLNGKLRPNILTPEYGEYERMLKENVRAADVIYCCTPSTSPLFPAGHLCSTEGRRKARYVAAVGSYKPHMQELPVEVLQQAVRGPEEAKQHHGGPLHIRHSAAGEGGAVIVDSIEGAMKESGEIIKSGIGGMGVVELGELVMLKRTHWAKKAEREERERGRMESEGKVKHHGGGHGLSHLFHLGDKSRNSSKTRGDTKDSHKRSKSKTGSTDIDVRDDDGGLHQWLQKGNVLYKSVGIGLMDVVVGMEVVRIAEERGIGTSFDDF